ncbi:aminodeoxychorismate lyase [Silvimonas iriomotensis]|uniref:aminodeoxychorismate lyase n=1 Tax=Silvimonas iriomotensis TaxID=449662 RepID=A0ABQ2P9N4_9NEIS|nr:aminodeoxychorismate lyase [Silvimonas iriomotensis]GGP21340.1 aminodeoxychorismate lyase [Silvimonas iriomotensis]
MRLINGQAAERLDLSDRAFQFGDGVFRTLYQRDGKVPFLQRHLAKLRADALALGIAAPPDELWLADLRQVGTADATLKLLLTRGETPRGYVYPADLQPNRVVQVAPLAAPRPLAAGGARVRVCEIRAGWQPRLAGIKHLNRLENVLARAEWQDPAVFEGLLLDRDDHVIEGCMSNVLMLENGRLITPLLDGAGVAGVMRSVVVSAAQQGWSVAEERITLPRLLAAQRVWLCNSLIGLVPVGSLAGVNWPVHEADAALFAAIEIILSKESFTL